LFQVDASLTWSARGAVIVIEDVFDAAAARGLALLLTHLDGDCTIDFAHSDIRLHALGSLLVALDRHQLTAITVRGLNAYHLAVLRSFGYDLDERSVLRRVGNGRR
jgi:hypothetical protein